MTNQRFSRRSAGVAGVAAGLLLTAGCTVGPDWREPKATAPASWATATSQPTTQGSTFSVDAQQVVAWWTAFNDPALNALVGRAVQSNLDLRQAESRIRQARAARGVASSGLWPQANATAAYRRSQASGASATGHDLYQAGFDATWELDVFGGRRRGVEAAEADIQAAVEDRRGVLVTLAAETAANYIDLRGTQQEIIIAQENLVSQQRSADLTRQRAAGGLVSSLDVANADAQVATTQSQIPLLEARARQDIYALSMLLGREPGALVEELSPQGGVPTVPPVVPVGMPSDLLRRRPDIRQAEARLHAATARIGVATADLFPKFSLTGDVGVQGSKIASLGKSGSSFWGIGPSASWAIFDAGRIRSNIKVQDELTEQALLEYQKTILTALQDVDNALVAYLKEQQHRQALVAAEAANRKAVEVSLQLYRLGQTDFLNVLSAQRSLFASQDALSQSTRTVATNLVALYKALGGGWETEAAGEALAGG